MENGVQREFRDGVQVVPAYIDEFLSGVDTLRYTYREALELATKARVSDHLNRMQQKVITEHFKELRGL